MKKFIVCFLVLLNLAPVFLFGCKSNAKILDCKINCELFSDKIKGSVQYQINCKKGQNLFFALYPNAFYKRENALMASCVKINGKEVLANTFGDNALFMQVQNLNESGVITVGMDFECVIESDGSRLCYSEEIYNCAYFYPVYLGSEKPDFTYCDYGGLPCVGFFNFDVRLTLPSNMSVACGGECVGVSTFEDKNGYRYDFKKALSFAFFASSKFNIVSKMWGYKRVNYYYCDDKHPENTLAFALDCLNFLNDNIGEYPYDVLSIVGMEINKYSVVQAGLLVVNSNQSSNAFLRSLSSAICKQYFSLAVDVGEYYNPYMGDGLSEFLTVEYLQGINLTTKEKHERYCQALIEQTKIMLGKEKLTLKKGLNYNLGEFNNKAEYFAVARYGGYLLFYCLDKECEPIVKVLNRFYKEYQFRSANASDFINCFKDKKMKAKKLLDEFLYVN